MEGCASARVDGVQSLRQVILVTGELLVDVNLVVEVNQKNLILRLAGSDESGGSLVHPLALGSHTPAVVND